jgi:Rieske Fe-S protein
MPARKATPSSATKQKSKAVTKPPVETPIAAKEKPVKEKPIVTVTEDSSPGIKSGKKKVVVPNTDAFYRGDPSLILDFSQPGSVFQHVSPLLSFIIRVYREVG